MDLTCLHCDKQIHIEDSRVPEGVFKVRCPGCGKLITAERDAESPDPPKQSGVPQSAPVPQVIEALVKREISALRQEILELIKATPAPPLQNIQPDAENNTLERASLPAWTGESVGNVALVCESDPATSTAISNTLKKLGYTVEIAGTAAECLKSIEARTYRIVTVDSSFPDDKDGANKIIGRINGMKPASRRLTFLANVSASTRTLDSGSAFFQGANIAVNKADLPKLENLIRDGLLQFQHFYQVFNRLMNDKDRQV